MRLTIATILLVSPITAHARGGDGWGWIIIGAPFVLLVFAVLGGYAEPKRRRGRRDDSGAFLIFIVSVFIGIPIAVFTAEFLADLVGVSKSNGAWLLLAIEVVCFVAYALWKERKDKEDTSVTEPRK